MRHFFGPKAQIISLFVVVNMLLICTLASLTMRLGTLNLTLPPTISNTPTDNQFDWSSFLKLKPPNGALNTWQVPESSRKGVSSIKA